MAGMSRADVPADHIWNLSDIFPDDGAFEEAIDKVIQELKLFRRHAQTLTQDEYNFLQYLRARDDIMAKGLRIFTYAELKFSEDGGDAHNQALMQRAQSAWHQLEVELSRLYSISLSQPEARLQALVDATGELSEYREYLKELMQARQHKLSPDAESALTAVSGTLQLPFNVYRSTTGADLRCGIVADETSDEFLVTPFSVLLRSATSVDPAFRKRAYDALIAGLRPYHNTLGTTFVAEIQKNRSLAQLRGYDSSADMLLHQGDMESSGDNVPVAFFNRVPMLLLEKLAPQMQRYARLRAQLWGVEKIPFADTKAPAVDTSAEKLAFSDARDMIVQAVAVMGPEYQDIIRRSFAEKWIYRGDNLGAMQGAYCASVPGSHPYVFDPFHGILYDAFTLIHELGHAAHGVYAQAHQIQQNTSSSRLFVEAPSTFNEHLLGRYLRQNGSRADRLRTICVQLFTFHHNFVTHLTEAELLRRIYLLADAGDVITTDILDKTQLNILQEFWGDTVELDEGAALTWMRQPHYYMGLYPYTYSVGLTASTALVSRLFRGENIGEAWIDVLKQGGSKHALDLFAEVGIDMNSDQPYLDAVAYVTRLIDELEAEL